MVTVIIYKIKSRNWIIDSSKPRENSYKESPHSCWNKINLNLNLLIKSIYKAGSKIVIILNSSEASYNFKFTIFTRLCNIFIIITI